MVSNGVESLERRKIDVRKFRLKRSEDLKTIEGVLDQSTMLVLYSLMKKGIVKVIHGVVATGKESNVYWAENEKGRNIALKIYRTSTADFKRMREYITGDPRFKRIKGGTRSMVFTWAEKEFKNLKIASEAGVRVPKPIAVEKNVLAMEFIGKAGTPAPRMKERPPRNPSSTLRKILRYVNLLYRKGELVHADLSEYNILVWKEPVIIDVSQAVHVSHPASKEYLRRDLKNILRYFSSMGVTTRSIHLVYEEITGQELNEFD